MDRYLEHPLYYLGVGSQYINAFHHLSWEPARVVLESYDKVPNRSNNIMNKITIYRRCRSSRTITSYSTQKRHLSLISHHRHDQRKFHKTHNSYQPHVGCHYITASGFSSSIKDLCGIKRHIMQL